ncbi:cellulose biosynthesis protein BcsN [Ancylobacter sp. MQZ15Z-1]|uniref:Cellulose biosynthesis protein BcsN n=1 Tax=Ancylobacter mangrovi TaxID=2972472 RepID=A0A9X2PEB5_9HYPH|nr:cellulose biosynthesis protein BcsN [Ancylobacter mangrovi]MCS0497126.1 cellulose biosynthesis protein BcsN [Ancylobacter mangrovi]
MLAGCTPYGWFGNNYAGGPQVATTTIEKPVSDALVLPEPGAAPPVIAVLQTDYLNAVEQEIILETNSRTRGQNAFYAVFFGPVKGSTGRENLRKDDWLNDEVLDDEMTERMPGVAMHVSNYYVQNRYGPFNYAIGNAGNGELCIYGWQRIQSQVPVYLFWHDRGILAIRLRLCQVGASEQDLLRVMYRYSINGYFLPQGWQPYGRPMGEPEGLGRVGGPLAYPSGISGDGTVLDGWLGPEPAPARTATPSRRRYGSAVPAPEPVVQPGYYEGNLVDPVEGYPSVPGPGTSQQLAPSTQPHITRGAPQPGAVVDEAPSRAVQSSGQNSPFSAPPVLPGVPPVQMRQVSPSSSGASQYAPAPAPSGDSGVGAPVRLVPGASTYPTPAN